MEEPTTMFTHLFNSREAAWYIYRKQFGRLPNCAWVIYMGSVQGRREGQGEGCGVEREKENLTQS